MCTTGLHKLLALACCLLPCHGCVDDEAEKLWVPWNEQVSLHGSIDLEQVNRQLKRDYEKNDRELLRAVTSRATVLTLDKEDHPNGTAWMERVRSGCIFSVLWATLPDGTRVMNQAGKRVINYREEGWNVAPRYLIAAQEQDLVVGKMQILTKLVVNTESAHQRIRFALVDGYTSAVILRMPIAEAWTLSSAAQEALHAYATDPATWATAGTLALVSVAFCLGRRFSARGRGRSKPAKKTADQRRKETELREKVARAKAEAEAKVALAEAEARAAAAKASSLRQHKHKQAI